MPTVLMITYHFPPSAASGSFRLLGFAQQLPAFGWDVAVVAPPGLPWEPHDPALSDRVPPATIIRSTPYPSHLPKIVRRLAPYNVWLPYARAAARKAVAELKPSVILTSGPPHMIHLVGRHLQKHFRLPWVADFRDPWIKSAFVLHTTGLAKQFELYWEGRVMKTADLILANAPKACEAMRNAYPASASRLTYLTNGYDPESFPETTAATKRDPSRPVRILHAGQLYVGRDPRPLLDALASLPAGTPRVDLEFLGRTDYAEGADLPADAKSRGLADRVLCRGQVKYAQVLGEMTSADILLLMDTPGRKIGVPAKLYEYLGAGRPVLATGETDGDLAAVLAESGVPHRIAAPDDVGAIRAAIADLAGGIAAGTLPPVSDEMRRRFSRATLAGKLAGMLDGLVRR